MKLSLTTCAEWMGGELISPAASPDAQATGYSIDTRTLQPGELFFAVSGDRFDAHTFVATAFERGAIAAVVAQSKLDLVASAGGPLIAVDEPLAALQRLGAAVRRAWGRTVVGLTGSAGKTTTKEMVAAVLSARYRTLKSAGNLNNHFGVPLQLLRLEPEHEYAVIEMGMSAAGEIALLASIAAPDWGVVTNVGMAHTQNFSDGIEGVARAKRELVEALDPVKGIAVLNADDTRVARFAQPFAGKSVLAGFSAAADVHGSDLNELGIEGTSLKVHAADGEATELRLHLLGVHNATNALLALAVGLLAGVPLAEGAAALAALEPGDKRGQVSEVRGAQVINDCYNSNPAALRAMIAALAQLQAKRRILVAGEMLELGPESLELHAGCGRAAAEAGIDVVLGVRGDAVALVHAAQAARATTALDAHFFETPEEAGRWLDDNLRAGDAVLLKGSRGVKLERALISLHDPGRP